MVKHVTVLGLVAASLAGCGGGNSAPQPRQTVSYVAAPTASGPINSACLASDRTARSRQLCGCIQAVANQTLTGSQQSRAVAFYGNPQQAQDVRQSDRASDEQFWQAYRAYSDRAKLVCS